MKKHTTHILAAALTTTLLLPVTPAFAGQKNTTITTMPEPSLWTFDAQMNLFMAGMSGKVAARGIPAEVDAGFGDLFKHLEAGVAGRFTLGYGKWSLSTEFSYLKLGVERGTTFADVQQWLIEPTLGYKVHQNVQLFAGARYNSVDTDVTLFGPLGFMRSPGGTQTWWDPIIGAQLSFPINEKLSVDGRFDVGGFGAGSDVTWQAFPYLNWRINKRVSAQIGYRWLGTDYTTGTGLNRFRYDVVVQGPQIGLTMHF